MALKKYSTHVGRQDNLSAESALADIAYLSREQGKKYVATSETQFY